MIEFFRRLRYNLLSENRFGRYLLYAIGEILLVVAGILIALSVNNQNEFKKDRDKETAILHQLHAEFQSNLDQLNRKIETKRKLLNSASMLFGYIDNPDQQIKDSIDFHIGRTITFSTFDPIVNDLASSGELRLLLNTQLKQMLSSWTSEVMDIREDELNWKRYRNEDYLPFLVGNYQLRSIRSMAAQNNLLDDYTIAGEDLQVTDFEGDIGKSKHEEDYTQLLKHPDFEDHMERCYSINLFAYRQLSIGRKRILEMLELLEQELKAR